MCLAVAIPAGKAVNLSKEEMAEGFRCNSHGAGFAFFAAGKTQIRKGFMEFDKFWDELEKVRAEHPDAPYMLHFRLATHGASTGVNTHPFRFKGGVIMHNGIIYGLGQPKVAAGDAASDTAHLAKLMHDVPVRALPYLMPELGRKIGNNNKLVVLDNTGQLHFANENVGHWREGIWYSNYSYRLPARSSRAFDESVWSNWHNRRM